jgi:hypothetical protein
MAVTSLLVYMTVAGVLRLARRRWPTAASPLYAMNMAMLLPLTLPPLRELRGGLWAAALLGVLVHAMGPAHRLRIHPVALVHMLILLGILAMGPRINSVLAPQYIVIGEVMRSGDRIGGPSWIAMSVTDPYESIRRDDPSLVMLDQQRQILLSESRLASLLRRTQPMPTESRSDKQELARLIDVLLGAVPGPIGATGKLLLVLGGLYLMHKRISRWPMAAGALLTALGMLLILPLSDGAGWSPAAARFVDVGWRVAVSYLAYQFLASPMVLVVLVMAPLTMPRSDRGRMIYAVLLGGGIVLTRWYLPHDSASYLPLVVAGLLTPLLDRLHRSPFAKTA